MIRIFVLFLSGLSLASTTLLAAEKISEKNWRNHPSIVEVRKIYDAIQKESLKQKWKKETKHFESCKPFGAEHKVTFDKSGKVRVYFVDTGSDDSAYSIWHYYDKKETLRFMYITAGTINGASLEHRIYFDIKGNKIWENRNVGKPGYTFVNPWPKDWVVFEPSKAFKNKGECWK